MKNIYEEVVKEFDFIWYRDDVKRKLYEGKLDKEYFTSFIKESFLKLLDNQIELAEKNITTETPDVLGGYYKMIGYNRALEDQITSLKEQKKLIEK